MGQEMGSIAAAVLWLLACRSDGVRCWFLQRAALGHLNPSSNDAFETFLARAQDRTSSDD